MQQTERIKHRHQLTFLNAFHQLGTNKLRCSLDNITAMTGVYEYSDRSNEENV